MSASEDRDDTSVMLTLVEHRQIPIPTAWEEFFAKKKAEFANGVQKLDENRTKSPIKALKKSLRLNSDAKADRQVMTINEALDQVTDLETFRSEVLTLIERFSKKKNKKNKGGPNWIERQTDRLQRGAVRIKQFHNGITSAVQCDPTGAASLFWGIILIVVQVCDKSQHHHSR